MTAEEEVNARRLIVTRASDISPFRHRGGWGPWRLDRGTRELYTDPGSHVGYRYAIDLEECNTSAQTLDWICQIASKAWGTDTENAATVAGLVNAFVDILHPQANLCSNGRSKQLKRKDIRLLIEDSVADPAWLEYGESG